MKKQMLRLVTIWSSVLKFFVFLLILVEIVVIYYAIAGEYKDLVINCIDSKLSSLGYLFSVKGPVSIILEVLIPGSLLIHFIKIDYSKRENILKAILSIFRRFTVLQLFVSFFLLLIFGYYLHNFYGFLSNKYKCYKL